jgi:cellulose synthase/poly-beta-1,6-N-acetylglucosamine synthase-like glycosyltransferase
VDESTEPITGFKPVADVITRIKLEDHRIRYFHSRVLKGIGMARNKAIKHSINDWILRVDDDSICDPEYLEKLVGAFYISDFNKYPEKIGAIGGIVPPYNSTKFIRPIESVSPIFNKILFSETGLHVSDDGGYFYSPNKTLRSGHLRSSFLFNKQAVEEVGGHPECGGCIGWREETVLSMRLIWGGYKLLTDNKAIVKEICTGKK